MYAPCGVIYECHSLCVWSVAFWAIAVVHEMYCGRMIWGLYNPKFWWQSFYSFPLVGKSNICVQQISGKWCAVRPAIIIFMQIIPPANLQSLRLTSSCKDGAVLHCSFLYQFFCLPCPLSVFHTHKAPSLFFLSFRTQQQTWPFKLLAPPSQAQWQRAPFLSAMPSFRVSHSQSSPKLRGPPNIDVPT